MFFNPPLKFSNYFVNLGYVLTYELIGIFLLVMLATAVMSWLIAFNVINPRSPAVYRIWRFLDTITSPVLAPVRRFIPALGGLDISFLVVWLLLGFIQSNLLGPIFYAIGQAVAGG